MISGVIDMYPKDPDTNIDNPEEFSQYNIWLQRKHKDNKIQTIITQNTTAQLDGGPNSHIFANINIFPYIHPDKCSVQIWNGSKDPEKGIGIVIIKIPKADHYYTLANILYSKKIHNIQSVKQHSNITTSSEAS